MAVFKVVTYNCKNFNGAFRSEFVSKLLSKYDFVCMQEHHLFESELCSFNDLCDGQGVMFTGTSAMDQCKFYRGRKFGGTAILWKAGFQHAVHKVQTVSKRISCVKIDLHNNISILLLNIYMPCDEGYSNAGFHEYQDILSEITVLVESHDATYTCIAGDLNTDLNRSTPHSNELLQFCSTEGLIPLVNNEVSTVTHTFESAHGSVSCIDHVLISQNMSDGIRSYYCYDDVDNLSDHVPIVAEFEICHDYVSRKQIKNGEKAAWYKASIADIGQYKLKLEEYLESSNVESYDVLNCVDIECTHERHITELNEVYDNIIYGCLQSAKECIPSVHRKNNKRIIPGFTEYCKPYRDKALYWHNEWKMQGRPLDGYSSDMRKQSRSEYHKNVRMVKKHENKIRSQRMSEAISCNKQRDLWHEVKKIRRKNKCLPSNIDGCRNPVDIAELFASKYDDLYNSVGYNEPELIQLNNIVNEKISNSNDELFTSALFNYDDVIKAINALKHNKHDGYSGLYSDHFINGTEKLFIMLVKLFNSMIRHGVCVEDMLLGTLTPIPKDKKASLCKSDNFRSICLQSILCKLIDVMMLNKQLQCFGTSNMQFGFKENMSTSLATSVVLETIDYYVNQGGSVYALALDATKAFDRVHYIKLFQMLIDRNVNPFYIRLLIQSYTNQKLRVTYNGESSDWFKIANGVKQGGVLSPTLFGIYVDGMLQEISKKRLGCNIGDVNAGIIGYADDVILLAPTVESLNKMVSICVNYAEKYCIKFNPKKSQLIKFGCDQNTKDVCIYMYGDKITIVNELKYLGTVISNRKNDSFVKTVKNDFVSKVNTFLGNFSNVSSDVKSNLFQQYCTSYYGSQSCLMSHNNFNELKVSWRKAIRRLWNVPYRTHCALLPHISCQTPCEIMLYKRFARHFISGYNHKNVNVSTIFKSSIYTGGRMFKNLNLIADYCKMSSYRIVQNPVSVVNRQIEYVWKSTIKNEDVRLGAQIRELCIRRDCINHNNDWHLSQTETNDIIMYLCTS